MRRRIASHPFLSLAILFLGIAVATSFLHAFIQFGGATANNLTNNWLYTAVEWVAVAVCGTRAIQQRDDRLAWTLMTLALASWSIGDLMWTVWLDFVANPPFPSAADIAYLLTYPLMYGSLMLLIRSRLRSAGIAQWLDGAVAGLAIGSIAAALAFSSMMSHTSHERFVAEAVNISYPVGDFVLLMFVACALSLSNWRPSRVWLVLGVGVSTTAIADIMYVLQIAGGNVYGTDLLDSLYLLAVSAMALAAWVPERRRVTAVVTAPHTIILTMLAAGTALGVLVTAALEHITPLAVALAAAALFTACARAALTYLENVRMLRESAREALTDPLSGLGNRRLLMADLDDAFRHARSGSPWTLVLFDLNGFKRYNDSFGHAAGDALLARIGASLGDAIRGRGRAYRLGGDEFCALLERGHTQDDPLIATLAEALVEQGSAFTVDATYGLAIIPDDASTASAALQLADERMYAAKARNSRGQARDVLMQLLNERTPGLLEHVSGVADLVRAVAAQFCLRGELLDEVLRAAELHDIGKLAIPDEILDKPGPLDEDEWRFMRQHSEIGERILGAAPALLPVAALVRASHERWDGTGYPDRLAGVEIPLGARIVAACDAYEAMTSDRCYQRARTRDDAIAELRRNAGTQFDPDVVAALCRHLESEAVERRAPAASASVSLA